MGNHHVVISHFECISGKEKEFKEHLFGILEAAKKQSGCLEFVIHQDLNNVNFFVVYERWESKNHYTKQLENEFNRAIKTKLSPFLKSPVSFHILSPL